MKVIVHGEIKNIEIGQKVLVAKCGSGHTVFGEYGKIDKYLEKQIVIKTCSGSIVKVDYDFNTVGKAKANNYFVSLAVDKERDLIVDNVRYWNSKKCCFENK